MLVMVACIDATRGGRGREGDNHNPHNNKEEEEEFLNTARNNNMPL
jgi:hypothetical protein